MVDDEILGSDRGEAIPAQFPDPLRKPGVIGPELEIRALDAGDLLQIAQARHTVVKHHVFGIDRQAVDDHRPEVVGDAGVDGEMDGDTPAPLLQRRLEAAHQVLGLFVDLEVGIANDPEPGEFTDLEAGKDPVEKERYHIVLEHEARVLAGQPHKPFKPLRQGDQRLQALAFPRAADVQRH